MQPDVTTAWAALVALLVSALLAGILIGQFLRYFGG